VNFPTILGVFALNVKAVMPYMLRHSKKICALLGILALTCYADRHSITTPAELQVRCNHHVAAGQKLANPVKRHTSRV